MLENISEAVTNYKKALDINPKKVECFYNLGNAYCNSGDFHEAIQYYLKAIGLDK